MEKEKPPELSPEPAEKPQGKVICAWCGKYMGPINNMEGETHGICLECSKKTIEEFQREKPPEQK